MSLLKFTTVTGCALAMGSLTSAFAQVSQPNIIFYLTEDLSPDYLAMFNDGLGAQTPNLEALSSEGLRYTNTYSNAAVSSAARTTLITGCYAPRFAGSFHRSIEKYTIPEGLHLFPYYLREAGYYTHNARKTDYNVALEKGTWDDITDRYDGWRKREDKSQPFFFQRSRLLTHESSLHFDQTTFETKKTLNNPDSVHLHSYLPDTELMRYTYATLYDKIEATDEDLGRMIEALREDGELDNTFIFFMGDNGGVLPGTKGYTNNIGLHVPMVVYIPKMWREKIEQQIGGECETLVSFVDLAATALDLAGISTPEQMDGESIFALDQSETDQRAVYCYGDRYDEFYSFNRSIRVGDMRYVRNYQPYQAKGLYAHYRYGQLAFREWREMWIRGELTPEQSRFFEPQPAQELYDLRSDPMETHNLAYDPRYASIVSELSSRLNDYLVKQCDLGFMPENLIFEQGLIDTEGFALRNRDRIAQAQQIAELQCLSWKVSVSKKLKLAMQSDDDLCRWWALTTAASFGGEASSLCGVAQENLLSDKGYIRSRTMLFLAVLGQNITQQQIQEALSMSENIPEALIILNDVAFMVENGYVDQFEVDLTGLPFTHESINWRVEYIAGRYKAVLD